MNPKIFQYLIDGNTSQALAHLQKDPTQINRMTVKGNSIFHIAAIHGIIEAFKRPFVDLLEHQNGRGLVLHQNERGDTILHCAARAGNGLILSSLFRYYGGNLEDLKNKRGNTVLHEAARGGHCGAVFQLVDARPEMAAVVNRDGESPLYLAAERGSVEAVEKLLCCSTAVVGGPRGQTALHVAILRSYDIAKKLLNSKPVLNRQVDDSESAPIHYAASRGDYNMVCILLRHDASVAHLIDNKGLSAIHIAAKKNYTNVIRWILCHCPDAIEITDTEGKNFLHVAVETRRVAVVKLVLNKSLLMHIINETDNEGNTPLHLAVKNRHVEMVHLLLSESRIDANVMNRNGLTPLDLALSCSEYSFELSEMISKLISVSSRSGPQRIDPLMGWDRKGIRSRKLFQRLKTMEEKLVIAAVLIATVTFSAAFTLPGGYDGDDSKQEQGMAILTNNVAFKIFLISDAIAMISSVCVTYLLLVFGTSKVMDDNRRFRSLITAINFIKVALGGMIVAFCTGIYVVVASKCRWLAALICGIACVPLVVWIIAFRPTFVSFKTAKDRTRQNQSRT